MRLEKLTQLLVLLALVISCNQKAVRVEVDSSVGSDEFALVLPDWLSEPMIPKDNPLTKAKVELGRRLFFERALSKDSSISCASCHLESFAFSDTIALSAGASGRHATRNTPSILNIAYAPRLMAEGGVKNLELQVLSPLENELEMNMSVNGACDRLNADSKYRADFERVWSDSATPFTLTRTLAAFERTLIGGDAPYDKFLRGDSNALSKSAQSGLALFTESGCINCHSGPLFTNYKLENNGLDERYLDNGLFRLTLLASDMGKFKVPTLRNVELTAPYMHDGRFITLREVLVHYNSGGKNHPNKSERVRPLNLSEKQLSDLEEFLLSLTQEFK
ncbi:MAG: cytochrome c peroxidase [Flavobacteriales bacterium]